MKNRIWWILANAIWVLGLIVLGGVSTTKAGHAAGLNCDSYRVSVQFPQHTQNPNNLATVDYGRAISICLSEYKESSRQETALNLALLYFGSYDFKRSVAYLLKANIGASRDARFLQAALQPTRHYARATNESDVSHLITQSLERLSGLATVDYAPAQLAYAHYILTNQQSGQQVKLAVSYLKNLTRTGMPEAMNTLGQYYIRTGNNSEATRILKNSAESGNIDGQRLYASLLTSTTGDFSNAYPWYDKAAQHGDLISKYNLLIYDHLKSPKQFRADLYRALLDKMKTTDHGRVKPPSLSKNIQSEDYYDSVRKRRAVNYLDLSQTGSSLFAIDEKQKSLEAARERLMLALLIEANEIRKQRGLKGFPHSGQYVTRLLGSRDANIVVQARDIDEQSAESTYKRMAAIMNYECRRKPYLENCGRKTSGDVAKAIVIGIGILAALAAVSSNKSSGRSSSSSYTPPHFISKNPGVDMAIMGLALQ